VKCTIDISEIPTDSTLVACPLCQDANTSRYAIQFSKLFLSCPTCQLVFLHPRHHLTEEEEKKRYEEHNNSPYDQRYRSFLAPVLDELMPLLGNNYDLHGLDYGCGPGPTLSTMFREKSFKMADYDPFFKPVAFIDNLQMNNHNKSQSNTTHTPETNSTNTPNTSTIDVPNTTTPSNTSTTDIPPKTENLNNLDKNEKSEKNPKKIPPYDKDPFNPADDHFVPPFDFITCTETAEHFRYPAEDFQKLFSPLLLNPDKGILAIMTQMLYSKEQFVNWWYLRDKTHVSFYTAPTMEYIAKTNNLRLILPPTKNIAIFIRNQVANKE